MEKEKLVSSVIDDYLAGVPEPARTTLAKVWATVRATLRALVLEGTTEELSYGLPTFKYKGSLLSLAAFAKHCSLFPCNGSLVLEMAEDLKGYKTSKGTIQFAVDKPLPAALLKKIVKLRVAENEAKAAAKRKA